MTEKTTLLAHLASKNYIERGEDAATDALAFILNESPECLGALNDLLRDGGFDLEPIAWVKTQVTDKDGSRPDMNGYDRNNGKRLVVEVKFWAALGRGQANCYFDQIDEDSPGVLLFIAPDSRCETLWKEIKRQMGEAEKEVEPIENFKGNWRARIAGSNNRLILVGWDRLLRLMADAAHGDSSTASDIRQLRGLARWQDDEAFQPIRREELDQSLARMIRSINWLIDKVIERGREKLEITTVGYRATPQLEGYGRYFGFTDVKGEFFLGVNFDLWATKTNTPLWLRIDKILPGYIVKLQNEIPLTCQDKYGYTQGPIDLKTGEEYSVVLDDIVSQISKIKDVLSQRN